MRLRYLYINTQWKNVLIINILMFLMDFSSYKTYLDLVNYLYNNKLDVKLDYYYFNYKYVNAHHNTNNSIMSPIHTTRYMENDYTTEKYGYNMTHTRFVESFMSVLKNYINNKDDLLDIDNPDNLYLNNIEWYDDIGTNTHKLSKEDFNVKINDIPYADIYLITSRQGNHSTACLSVELALALYLIRKHNSKVFIGGNHYNQLNNMVANLINAVGREYTNDKLEYLIGTIGINVYNYIKGYEYQNTWSQIERQTKDLAQSDLDNRILGDEFMIELIRGCKNRCVYCSNPILNSKYDIVPIETYHQWLNLLNNNLNYTVHLMAPEINTDNEYFIHTLKYIINNNLNNKFQFYLNINCITDEQISLIKHVNINDINIGIDLLFDGAKYNKYNNMSTIDNVMNCIDKLLELNAHISMFMVANVPMFLPVTFNQYKDIFKKYHEFINWSEFQIPPVTDYIHNPSKYGIRYIYYNNRYKELSSIDKYISKLPVMYFRTDLNRKEMVNNKYDILKNMTNVLLFQSNNVAFLFSLVHDILSDLDLVDNHNYMLDKFIINYSNKYVHRYSSAVDIKEKIKLLAHSRHI